MMHSLTQSSLRRFDNSDINYLQNVLASSAGSLSVAAHGFDLIGVIHYVPFAFSVKETHTNDAKHVK